MIFPVCSVGELVQKARGALLVASPMLRLFFWLILQTYAAELTELVVKGFLYAEKSQFEAAEEVTQSQKGL